MEELRRRGVGKEAVVVVGDHVGEGEIGALHLRPVVAGRRQRLFGDGQEGQAGRQHEALLRAGDGEIDAPFVLPEVDRGDGRDAVDEDQCRVLVGIEQPPDAGDIRGDARRGLVVGDEDGADRMGPVRRNRAFIGIERHAGAPFHVDGLDVEPEPLGHVDPQMRELAEARHQHPVAARQGILDGRFPGPGAGGGIHEDAPLAHLEDALQILEEGQRQGREVRRPLVFHRHVHRPPDALRDIGWAGNVEMPDTVLHAILPDAQPRERVPRGQLGLTLIRRAGKAEFQILTWTLEKLMAVVGGHRGWTVPGGARDGGEDETGM